MKLLFLFDKDFDFTFLKKTFDAFSDFYFGNTFSKSSQNNLANFKQVLSMASSTMKVSNESSIEHPVLSSKEYKSLLINFDIFQNDLKLFSQELSMVEEAISLFLSKMWMLQDQIQACIQLSPLMSKDNSSKIFSISKLKIGNCSISILYTQMLFRTWYFSSVKQPKKS
jgi:hypothetical protein